MTTMPTHRGSMQHWQPRPTFRDDLPVFGPDVDETAPPPRGLGSSTVPPLRVNRARNSARTQASLWVTDRGQGGCTGATIAPAVDATHAGSASVAPAASNRQILGFLTNQPPKTQAKVVMADALSTRACVTGNAETRAVTSALVTDPATGPEPPETLLGAPRLATIEGDGTLGLANEARESPPGVGGPRHARSLQRQADRPGHDDALTEQE